jgi:large subunit ribosomal protein L31
MLYCGFVFDKVCIKNRFIMKEGIHPKNYRLVVFRDMSNGHSFLSRSTANSGETVKWEDGNEYPVIKLEISNTSHPFYTGKNMLVDTAGRIDKFKKRYEKKK